MLKTLKANRGAVVAPHHLASQAGLRVLRDGGNAFAAIIAAQCMACVAEPVLASLGGGGFLLAKSVGEHPCVYDFFVQSPAQRSTPDEFYPIEADFGTTTQTFHIGFGSAAVPGCVAGMYAIAGASATLPMSRLVEPAVQAARAGVIVNDFQGYIFDIVRPIYEANSHTTQAYANARTGRRLRQGALADTLQRLAAQGAELFYSGEIAAQPAAASSAQGGASDKG